MKTPTKIDKPAPIPLPGIGAIVLYHASEDVSWPMIVTSVGDGTVSGQSFMAGTETGHVENATMGDGVGQLSTTNSKEA